MRFVIVDLEGASRDYFSDRGDLVDALLELEVEHAGTATELFVVTYDDEGERLAEPERGDEVLEQYSSARTRQYGATEVSVWSRSASRTTLRPERAGAAGRSREAVCA